MFRGNVINSNLPLQRERQTHAAGHILLVLLMICGLLANMFAPRLFMGFNYLFGSIPVLLVLRLYGTGWGMVAGAIAGSWTYVLFGHPYAIVWLTAEPLFIGIVLKHSRIRNLVILNTIYWPLAGIPLLWFFFYFIMELPFVGTLPAALMFWVIGIANSLIVTIILQFAPYRWASRQPEEYRTISIGNAIFSIMMAIVVLPSILVMILNGRAILSRNENAIVDRLLMTAATYQQSIHLLLDAPRLLMHPGEVEGLPAKILPRAGGIASWVKKQDGTFEQQFAEPGFALDPAMLQAGHIVPGHAGFPESVAIEDVERDCLVLLRLDYLKSHFISLQEKNVNQWATLLDPDDQILFTSNPRLVDQKSYKPHEFGEPRLIRDGIYQLLPAVPHYTTLWRRVQNSWYGIEVAADQTLDWTWVIEIPFAPFQQLLLRQQTHSLSLLLALCLLALAVSFVMSRRFSASILKLAETTTELTDRVENDQSLDWPDSRLAEVRTLTCNFKEVAAALRARFKELKRSRDLMEENVRTRTAELNTAKEQAERVYRLVPSAFFAVDTKCRIIIWNKKAEEITGYRSDEVLGQNCRIFSSEPCSTSCLLSNDSQIPAEGVECKILCKDGKIRIASKNIDYLLDCDSHIIGGIESFEDITEKKELEDHLRQACKMEAIGTLAGGIAHDFNNILSAIIGFTELARENDSTPMPIRNNLDQVIKAGHRAKNLVKQILAFSRQTETEHVPVQPAAIVKESINLLRSSLPATIEIRQDIDPEVDCILADPTQIHQIVMNLCTNAYHAMEETGGLLSLSLKRKVLPMPDESELHDVQPVHFVQLTIEDTGSGIPPEIQNRIFDPYFTTKGIGKGTGMGLAIVHGIVKSYGGQITCRSTVGKGTVFEINLPAFSDSSWQDTPEARMIPVGIERILLVDDETMLAEMGQALLQGLGYKVTTRISSTEALTLFKSQPDAFDLVITDQTMPEMTGLDLAGRMLQIRPNLPIVLCTGYSSLISEEKVVSAGIKGFAHKPLAKKDIADLIRKVLDGAQCS